MKNLVLTLLVIFAVHRASAGGSMDSGGGSASAAEFVQLGHQAGSVLRQLVNFPMTTAQFEDVIQNTHVEFTNQKLRDSNNLEVDALNFPAKKVVRVNLDRWARLMAQPTRKFQLVIHEYLGIAGINDKSYRWSQKVMDGGIKLTTLTCRYNVDDHITGFLTRYEVDLDGDGKPDDFKWGSVVHIKDHSEIKSVLVGGLAVRGAAGEIGTSISWQGFIPTHNAFIPENKLHTNGKFQTKYFSLTHFAEDGAPLPLETGVMSCEVKVP